MTLDLVSIKSDPAILREALEQAGVSRWLGPDRRQCRCPFHDDRRPSAGIYRAKEGTAYLFACGGCSVSGDVFHVIALSRNVSDAEVLRHLNETGELLGGIRPGLSRPSRPMGRPAVRREVLEAELEAARLATYSDGRRWILAVAGELGVTVDSLDSLGCGRKEDLDCAAFPMTDATDVIIGIRYRWSDGEKRSRTGSRGGLFAPVLIPTGAKVMWVVEGPTDVAAMLSLGLWCVGLPAARQGIDHLDGYVARHKPIAVVAVADNNPAGKASATLIAHAIVAVVACVKTILPPRGAKDVREFVKSLRATCVEPKAIRGELLAAVGATRPTKGRLEKGTV